MMTVHHVVQWEEGVAIALGMRLAELFPGLRDVHFQRTFPDLLLHFASGEVQGYELEVAFSAFIKHGHHRDQRPCHGIIYWKDDVQSAKAKHGAIVERIIQEYHLIHLGQEEEKPHGKSWVTIHTHLCSLHREGARSISEVAALLNVTKRTVYNWLVAKPWKPAMIGPDQWFRLPKSGRIRIRNRAVLDIMQKARGLGMATMPELKKS
jgi:DNA-binding transcriptional regulator YiaG